MAETIRCEGCNGPIENPSSPDVLRAVKSVKPATLTGKLKAAGDDVAYFHNGCFHSQRGYERA
ncbi:MAG TPA: hypothetical protein VHJ78_13890 [Actinomycetota bacterium]|nr:hypothetical protein [Actinomycetota bacterium]